ncbi:MAG: hypothetical protein ACE5LB_12700 [Acidiferrobacterales bacterium]
MDIEQIGLFVVGWLAVGFLVALVLGKILREANEPVQPDPQLRDAENTANASVRYVHATLSDKQTYPLTPDIATAAKKKKRPPTTERF